MSVLLTTLFNYNHCWLYVLFKMCVCVLFLLFIVLLKKEQGCSKREGRKGWKMQTGSPLTVCDHCGVRWVLVGWNWRLAVYFFLLFLALLLPAGPALGLPLELFVSFCFFF